MSKIDSVISNHLTTEIRLRGEKLLKRAHIIDPWEKGGLSEYLLFSAVISEGNARSETRIKYKAETDVLSSKCNCVEWNDTDHCPHVATLMLHYRMLDMRRAFLEGGEAEDINMGIQDGMGVYPEFWGTIVTAPNKLQRAPSNATFTSMYYKLTDGEQVKFPTPQKMSGMLKIDLKEETYEENDREMSIYKPYFSWLNDQSEDIKEVSIFEHLYLFDWKHGDLFELPNELKGLLREIIHGDSFFSLERYLQKTILLRNQSVIKLYVEGTDVDSLEKKIVDSRVSIVSGRKRSSLTMIMEFHDEDKRRIPIPYPYFLFAFKGALLDSFKKKMEAYAFLQGVISSIEQGDESYIHFLRATKRSSELRLLIKTLLSGEEFELLYKNEKGEFERFAVPTERIRGLFKSMWESFGESFFRFSSCDTVEHLLVFDISKTMLVDNIYDFYLKTRIYDLPIFYNESEVTTWSSSTIRFERREKNDLDWFDLSLMIGKEDLSVIENATIDSNAVLTEDGLLLLTAEQKSMMKLLKRYTTDGKDDEKLKDETGATFFLPLRKSRIFELFELRRMGIDGALTDDELDFCNNLATLDKIPEYEVPEIYKGIAREYQVTGFRWLRFLYEYRLGACLSDEMGLGKTIQTIMFIESIINDIDRVLIVCPVSILLNWEKEFSKFSNLGVEIYYGTGRSFPKDSKIVLTSYGLMKKEALRALKDYEFDLLIMDEVQHLKNVKSMGASAARQIKAKFRMSLTGTPVENDISEFYNILDLCVPGVWGDLRNIKATSTKETRLLAKQVVRPFILRRTKQKVLKDLPPKEENLVFLSFSEEEKLQYKKSLDGVQTRLTNVVTRRRYGEILKGILELRQLCLWQNANIANSTKITYLIENLQQILEGGGQAIVFSQFTTYLDHIQKEVEKKLWRFSRIDGKQSFKRRHKEVEKFQAGMNPIFLISLRAGGVGLNLTAANYIFLMDPWWNPAVENQAIDRAHRIGQKNQLTVYRPVIKGSVEEKVLVLQERKRELFTDLMDTDEEKFFSGKLTMDDFQMLLTD